MQLLPVRALDIKEGETSPPKRYNSGSMILAMENAGQLMRTKTPCPDQRKRNRNKCDKSRDSEKACEYQVSRIEQEDTGDHTDAAGRDDL